MRASQLARYECFSWQKERYTAADKYRDTKGGNQKRNPQEKTKGENQRRKAKELIVREKTKFWLDLRIACVL